MLALGAWLVAVGVCDLLRASRDATSTARRWLVGLVGLAVMAAVLVVLVGSAGVTALLVAALGLGGSLLAWVWGSSAALDAEGRGGSAARTGGRAVAVVGLLGGVAIGLALSGDRVVARWPGPLDSMSGLHEADRVVLALGVALVQLSTANIAVRMLLDAVGVPAAKNEQRLKGGRVLGPMERIFILALGSAGALTAAALVVAAKGLLRFPELQAGSEPGPSEVTEYFLIGSFASWLLPLAGLGLLSLS